MNFSKMSTVLAGCLLATVLFAQQSSTAGFFSLPDSGREVINFNTGWRFLRGPAAPEGLKNKEIRVQWKVETRMRKWNEGRLDP